MYLDMLHNVVSIVNLHFVAYLYTPDSEVSDLLYVSVELPCAWESMSSSAVKSTVGASFLAKF